MQGKTIKVTCNCGAEFTARVADRNRGWAKSCSKSCAAIRTNRKTGNFQRFINKERRQTSARSSQEMGETWMMDIEMDNFNRDFANEDGFNGGDSEQE